MWLRFWNKKFYLLVTTKLFYINVLIALHEIKGKLNTYNDSLKQTDDDIAARKANSSNRRKTINDLLRKYLNDVRRSRIVCNKSTSMDPYCKTIERARD
jgi:hypothetical protein